MLYLGLDVHSKWFTLAGFDKTTGEVFSQKKTANSPEAMSNTLLPTSSWLVLPKNSSNDLLKPM